MTLMTITIISLICIGIFLCILALIYTKIIKPNDFGYSKKNILIKQEYDNLIKKLNSQSKTLHYENICILDNNKQIIINRLLVTKQNSYIITNFIDKKVIDVERNKNNIKLIYPNKKLSLPLDINCDVENYKLLRKNFSQFKENIILIVPMINKSFEMKTINNIVFIQEENLYNEIKKIEDKPSNFDWKEFVKKIDSKMIKQKKRKKLFS